MRKRERPREAERDLRRREREQLRRSFSLSRARRRDIARPDAGRDEFEPLDPASSGLEYVAGDSCAQGGERDRQDQSPGRIATRAISLSVLYIG